MKILSAAQVREADAYTIQYEPILSIDLMERAATACVDWLLRHLDYGQPMYIFCGLGNNGGDGLAIARMLSLCGVSITVCIVRFGGNSSTDFQINLARLQEYPQIHILEIAEKEDFPTLPRAVQFC